MEAQTILVYPNIKAVKTTIVDSTIDSLGERNLGQMNIDSSLIPKLQNVVLKIYTTAQKSGFSKMFFVLKKLILLLSKDTLIW